MSLVLYEVKERIGYITLNRPEKRNALNSELVGDLYTAFSQAEADSAVKVIVLRAVGDSFCAGADLAYLQQLQQNTFEQNLDDSNQLKKLFLKIYTLQKVVIAQVQGHALAGGCGLVSVCDFSFATPDVKLGYTEVKIGFIPAIVSVFLLRKLGEQKAKQLLLTGFVIKSNEALELGLLNYVIDAAHIESKVLEFAQQLIQSNSTQSMQLTKQLIGEVQSMSLNQALDYAAELNAKARASDDCKTGIAAFLNKQELTW
jgi:methylglutaconyl-CoA hydratase